MAPYPGTAAVTCDRSGEPGADTNGVTGASLSRQLRRSPSLSLSDPLERRYLRSGRDGRSRTAGALVGRPAPRRIPSDGALAVRSGHTAGRGSARCQVYGDFGHDDQTGSGADRRAPGPWPGSQDVARLRVSDADRDRAAAELGEHFQAGRLTQEEFDERVGKAINARTQGDLDELLADLPSDRPAGSLPASGPARQRPGTCDGPGRRRCLPRPSCCSPSPPRVRTRMVAGRPGGSSRWCSSRYAGWPGAVAGRPAAGGDVRPRVIGVACRSRPVIARQR